MARSDSKLKNLPREVLDELWEMKCPSDKETKAMGLVEICAEISKRYDIEIGKSALGEFYQWLELKMRMENAADRAEQSRLEMAKDPSFTSDDIDRVSQIVFSSEALKEGNVKAYVALAKLKLAASKQALESQKLVAAAKDKIEAGLDALFAEIKGNTKAEKLFAELKAVVAKS